MYKNTVKKGLSNLRHRLDAVKNLLARTSDAVENVKERTLAAQDNVKGYIVKRPFKSLGIAILGSLASGVCLGFLIRKK